LQSGFEEIPFLHRRGIRIRSTSLAKPGHIGGRTLKQPVAAA
jgi:hypothetical protein